MTSKICVSEMDARVKAEFLLPRNPVAAEAAEVVEEEKKKKKKRPAPDAATGGAAAAKRAKKANARQRRQQPKLCSAVAIGQQCTRGSACRFSHDVDAFLATKPPDLPGQCPWTRRGVLCPFGLRCRFASAHIATGASESDKKTVEESSGLPDGERNALLRELQAELRKRSHEYPRAVAVLNELTGVKAPATAAAAAEPHVLAGSETTVRLPEREKRRIDWTGKLYLPPLTTVGNLPFRRICKELGADVTCGEMCMANNLLSGQNSEWALLRRHSCEDLFGVQIATQRPNEAAYAAELLQTTLGEDGFDFLDINAACPIDAVCRHGCGGMLLDRTNRIGEIARPLSRILTCPVTLKIRTGRDEARPTVRETIFPRLAEWGISAVILHGRSRNQRYTKQADWAYIESCARVCPAGVTCIGNGDIYSYADFEAALQHGVATASIARAALIKPWVFTEIKERRVWDITSRERFDLLQRFVGYGLDHWGSDGQGVESTRTFLCEWLSFLWRYVPAGILEAPMRLQDRPPRYRGRDDLETLFASNQAADWVKISELFLGPSPDSFKFVPKHKSNAVAPVSILAANAAAAVADASTLAPSEAPPAPAPAPVAEEAPPS